MNTDTIKLLTCKGGMRRLLSGLVFISCISLYSQTGSQLVIGQQPVYRVIKAREPVTVDGKMNEKDWERAEVRTFDYFYRADKPAEEQKTRFRMMWDNANIYLFFQFEDTSLTAREKNSDGRPYLDDCAEFFCVPVPDSVYFHFGFEVNILKAVYDFVVLWRYYNDRTIFIKSYNPEFKAEVAYDGTLNDDSDRDRGWQIEFAIPFEAFSDFHLMARPRAGVRWAFQAVRQDRNFVNDRFRSTSTLFPIYDIRKDVHQPSRFGLLEFSDY